MQFKFQKTEYFLLYGVQSLLKTHVISTVFFQYVNKYVLLNALRKHSLIGLTTLTRTDKDIRKVSMTRCFWD